MYADYLFLVATGPILAGSVAFAMAFFQFWFFLRNRRYPWLGWASLVCLAASLYDLLIYLNFNTSAEAKLALLLRLMYTALLVLFYALTNFILSFLGRGTRLGQRLFILSMLTWLGLVWFSPWMVTDHPASRASLWLGGYYPRPVMKPLGLAMLAYFGLILLRLFWIWPWKKRKSLSQFPYLTLGMIFWASLGCFDILSSVLFGPARIYLGEYGVLGFCFSMAAFTITNYQDLERSLQQAKKTEALASLAGGIAHDFKNLLQVISLNAEILLELSPAPAPVGNYAWRIIDATQRGTALVRGLLSLGRQGGRPPQPLELNQEVRRAAGMLGPALPVIIKLEQRLCSVDLPIWGQPEQIEQILLNLAFNARDAMPQGGSLILTTNRLEVTPKSKPPVAGLRPGAYCQLSVADSGTGMDSQVVERVFDPFFTTKPTGQGSGLGLSTIQGIMETLGGAIACLSAPGQGTIFQLYWPMRPLTPSLAPAGGLIGPAPPVEGPTVLLVDDEVSLLESLAELLRLEGYQVLTALSGAEALSKFQAQPARLVIMDLMMPGLKAPEVVERLRQLDHLVKIIVISGDRKGAQEQLPLDANVVAHLGKPVAIGQLREAIGETLRDGQAAGG